MISDVLIEKINNKNLSVGIIGLGYVGLNLLVSLSKSGYRVNGYDINDKKISSLMNNKSYITGILDEDLERGSETGKTKFHSEFSTLADNDIFLICIQTNLDKHKSPNLRPLESASDEISHALRGNQLIVLESTVFPGSMEDIVIPRLENHGQRIDRDYLLSASPERIDPGNEEYSLEKTPKLVGSLTEESQKVAVAFYKTFIKNVVPVKNSKIAQLSKLLENTYRAVNIALINELMMISEKLGVDMWDVVDAAGTKPYGFSAFYPGPGTGGSCIPIDPLYLVWKIGELNEHSEFIELAAKINERVPRFLVDRVSLALNEHGYTIKKSKIMLLGITYKPDVADLSQTPVFPIMTELLNEGAQLYYYDPFYSEIELDGNKMISVELKPEVVKSMDMIIITSNHSSIDYQLVKDNAKLIFDSRNQYRQKGGKVYRL